MRRINKTGFTLVEMLTTIAIIAILIGLLVPALSMVLKTTLAVSQKAQFAAITQKMEDFSTDNPTIGYPPSNVADVTNPVPLIEDTTYTGAQRLAEAMIGRDGFGFHPNSLWRTDGLWDSDSNGSVDSPVYDSTSAANRAARKGPYLELEHANAVLLKNIYGVGNLWSAAAEDTYVLADKFRTVKNLYTQKTTGMPILYYRADTAKSTHTTPPYYAESASISTPVTNIYWIYDNSRIYNRRPPGKEYSPMRNYPAGYDDFYRLTQNPNFTSPVRPYRSQSFILQSAGPDGLYGTADDVFNFDETGN